MAPRSLRKKPIVVEDEQSDDGVEQEPKMTAEDIRVLQQQRKRQQGLAAAALLQRRQDDEEGGATLASSHAAEEGSGLGAAFKRELRREEAAVDVHMQAYVEAELAARLGRQAPGSDQPAPPRTLEDELYGGDGEFARKVDAELGPSWVAGIAEVPLSLEQRLKNIEGTEAAKEAMLVKSGMAGPGLLGADEDDVGDKGAARSQFPVFFGKQDAAMMQRIEEARAVKRQKQTFYAEKRAKKKQEDRPSW